MRLFVAVWPPGPVCDVLARLERREDAGVRWTTRMQWHVTLAFLGDVDEERLDMLADALSGAAASLAGRQATMGSATRRLGHSALVVPVAGIEDLAEAVRDAAAAALGRLRETRPFRGHVTLARSRGKGAVPRSLAGIPVEVTWPVEEISLVRSHLGKGPARYEKVATAELG